MWIIMDQWITGMLMDEHFDGLYKIISVDYFTMDLTLLAKNWMKHQTLRASMNGDFTGQRPLKIMGFRIINQQNCIMGFSWFI